MRSAAKQHEEPNQDRAQPGPVSRIVVTRPTPGGEAILQEIVVAHPRRATQNVLDDAETGEACGGLLVKGSDFAGGRSRADGRVGVFGVFIARRDCGIVCDVGCSCLVWVELPGQFSVCFDDFVVGC